MKSQLVELIVARLELQQESLRRQFLESANEVKVDRYRCCVSNYYFSPDSPIGRNYFNVTSFSARPEQHLLRALAWVDNKVRRAGRLDVPRGLGKKDIYEGSVK